MQLTVGNFSRHYIQAYSILLNFLFNTLFVIM